MIRVSQLTIERLADIDLGMDEWTEPLQRVVLIANRKGGVLKSSLVRGIAAVLTTADYKVLVVDGDPQANVSKIDFGLDTDRGRSLAMAMQYGMGLETQTVKGVDVVSGGPELQGALGAATSVGAEVNLEANLRAALGRLCVARGYDLVLIDSGPGDTRLLDAYLNVARWLIVPTNSDEASLDGLDMMGSRYAEAVQRGASVKLLGAVLTMVDPKATVRNQAIRGEIAEALGEAAAPFEAMIRYAAANAIDARRHGLSAQEVAAEAVSQRKSRLASLRQRAEGADQAKTDDRDMWWSRSSGDALAGDYNQLTREILARIGERELVKDA